MQRLKVLGLALMAVFMLGAVASVSASAVEVLPKFSVETEGTGKFGKSKLNLKGANLTSEKGVWSKSTITPGTQGRIGTYDELDQGVTLLGEPCLSLGDALGTVLFTGEWILVHLPGTAVHISLLLVRNETHVECPGLGVLLLYLAGSTTLILILPVGTKTKVFKLLLNVNKEEQEDKEWVDDPGKVHKTELLVTINSGKGGKAATEEAAGDEIETTKETVIEKE